MRVSIIYLLALAWMVLSVSPAQAMTCSLYPEDPGLDTLKREAALIKNQVRRQPERVRPYCWLSHIYFKLAKEGSPSYQEKMYNHCVEYADSAIGRDPKAAAAYFMKALCLGKRGELQGIWSSLGIMNDFEENMQRAAQLDPGLDKGGPHRGLGNFYMQVPGLFGGSLEKAIQHFEKAVEYGPDFWENLLYLGEAYYEDGRYAEARKTLNHLVGVIRQQPFDPELRKPLEKARTLLKKIERYAGSP